MIHQPFVQAIVETKRFQVVGVVVETGEILEEDRQQIVARIALDMDDWRVWEQQPEQSELLEIVRQLVADERLAVLDQRLHLVQVGLGVLLDLIPLQIAGQRQATSKIWDRQLWHGRQTRNRTILAGTEHGLG